MKKNDLSITLRIPSALYRAAMQDLRRPHPFAAERVGFFSTSLKRIKDKEAIITITDYHSVPDEYYVDDPSVGAKINSNAIREALQRILTTKRGCLHVHLHDHNSRPTPSFTDQESLPPLVESFSHINRELANGYLILSRDSFFAAIQIQGVKRLLHPAKVTVVGYPSQFSFFDSVCGGPSVERYDRQSFLGPQSTYLFENVRVGIVGLGGGGSHIAQQLAHVGILNYAIFDDDRIEESNLNRLIGGYWRDVARRMLKTLIARRLIRNIVPKASIEVHTGKWQTNPELLQRCDIVVGCIDSYSERAQLEAECRRYLIPYIDIGMDIHQLNDQPPAMSGQVILSMPGTPCLSCLGFFTEEKMAEEAKKYGDLGGRPQVVWPNGVLASTAVGVLTDIVTGWTGQSDRPVYLLYDGNLGTVKDHIRLRFAPTACMHYHLENSGEPIIKKLYYPTL
jgi:molybdopterin/thiamine biosynthesis adenylyltransferase